MSLPRLSSMMLLKVAALWKTILRFRRAPYSSAISCYVRSLRPGLTRSTTLSALRLQCAFPFIYDIIIRLQRALLLQPQYRHRFSAPALTFVCTSSIEFAFYRAPSFSSLRSARLTPSSAKWRVPILCPTLVIVHCPKVTSRAALALP